MSPPLPLARFSGADKKTQSTEDEIRAAIGSALEAFQPFHNQILVGIYIRPAVTSGGVILTDKSIDEDKWQGKAGLVLAVGPMAFKDDARNSFEGQGVCVGDWIIYRVSDGFSIDINGVHCRLIEDVHVKARVSAPSIVW